MKKIASSLAAAFLLLVLTAGCTHFSLAQQQKTRVLVISGGHGFKHEPFYEVFNSIPSITYDTLVQPQANAVIRGPRSK
jgi:uncharacterized protein